ncbi:hypothetical protein HMPREF0294_0448 [Corynebacterium glucuronolyticum ATCC 51867]|uniref:Uncharacterized protein n=1 Tax=Corynebacterium glucuronolyticum ATCC 51866 TaxID=548478 RepID=A0ABM9XMR3_9CORY|nr:hypothetical protein HMPREF0294_0448 [Corynebacterium glucuronolyticum ATCC 51867]EEI62457.1 hypothetical protein HMPREF0293_2038 [Corynebacterium glucuronolyticum ATCC 51866]
MDEPFCLFQAGWSAGAGAEGVVMAAGAEYIEISPNVYEKARCGLKDRPEVKMRLR